MFKFLRKQFTHTTVFDYIIKKQAPADILYEDDKIMCFKSIEPIAPIHYLIIPKEKGNLDMLENAEHSDQHILGYMLYKLTSLAKQLDLEDGYRVIINNGDHGCNLIRSKSISFTYAFNWWKIIKKSNISRINNLNIMSLQVKNNLLIHVNHFKQLDHYFQSLYKIQIKIYVCDKKEDKNIISNIEPLFEVETMQFSTIIYQNTQIDEYFSVQIESSCFPSFQSQIYIEVIFYVKGIKSKKFPQNEKGFSKIGTNILQIKNPQTNFHEYIELIYDDLICSVVSLGVHNSVSEINFRPILQKQNSFMWNKNQKKVYKSQTFEEFLENITHEGDIELIDSFYKEYLIRQKNSVSQLLNFIVQSVKTLIEQNNGQNLNQNPKKKDILLLKEHLKKISIPKSKKFTDFINEAKQKINNQVLASKFNFKSYNQNPNDILETPRKSQTTSIINLRNEINNFEQVGESICKTDIIVQNNRQKFIDFKKINQFVVEEIDTLGRFNNKIFADLRVLIQLSGKEINQQLRMDYHQIQKERYLDNVLSQKFYVDFLYEFNKEKEMAYDLVAERFRKNLPEQDFQFQSFRIDNLSIFDEKEIRPIFFEQIYSTNQSYLKQQSNRDMKNFRSELFRNVQHSKPKVLVTNKSFVTMKLDKNSDCHLVVLVHGYNGSDFEMRLYKNYIAKLFPHSHFLLSKSNSKQSDISISQMGKNLSNEIIQHIQFNQQKNIQKISFIGHSLGGIVIRAALPHLKEFQNMMYTYMSLSSPHLGCQFSDSKLVDWGFKILKKFKNSQTLKELDLDDSPNFQDTFIYKLSKMEGLNWFKNVILISSQQDFFVNYESARIQITPNLMQNKYIGQKYLQIAKNIFNIIQRDKLIRMSIDLRSKETSFKWYIGQAAHIMFLDSHQIIQTLMYKYGDYFCQLYFYKIIIQKKIYQRQIFSNKCIININSDQRNQRNKHYLILQIVNINIIVNPTKEQYIHKANQKTNLIITIYKINKKIVKEKFLILYNRQQKVENK